MTGTPTARFTSRMMVLSARPAYILAPGAAMDRDGGYARLLGIWANSTALTLPLSQPLRIFTVTGQGTASRTARMMARASSGFSISAEPSPLLTTLPTDSPC
jgi:hypothetical protein